MKSFISLFSGLLFGLGLIISGMTNPVKVIGFLDITGNWDPSLAFVLFGGISIAFFGFRVVKDKKKTIFDDAIQLPNTHQITKELVIGSLLFGSGWAIAGFCPGPALVAFGEGHMKALIFVISMIVGMVIHGHFFKGCK
jgi:uncharacterized membrane protein YedE/YeeE